MMDHWLGESSGQNVWLGQTLLMLSWRLEVFYNVLRLSFFCGVVCLHSTRESNRIFCCRVHTIGRAVIRGLRKIKHRVFKWSREQNNVCGWVRGGWVFGRVGGKGKGVFYAKPAPTEVKKVRKNTRRVRK